MLVLGACGSSDGGSDGVEGSDADSGTSSTNETDAEAGTSVDPGQGDPTAGATTGEQDKPGVEIPGGDPPTELVVEDLVEGDGDVAEPGTELSMNYVGVLFEDGTEFDTSYGRGPFNFTLGAQMVIQGWDDGIEGMKVGGRRKLIIPPDLAYGPTGTPTGSIGPDQTLVFVVDLLSVTPGPEPIDPPELEIPDEPVTELVIDDLTEGDGSVAEAGDQLSVHYHGIAQSTGEVFDSSYLSGEPVVFPIGVGSLIPGWDEGIPGMKVGGVRRLVIPPDLAYGAAGQGPIGPDETLVFAVELLDIVE